MKIYVAQYDESMSPDGEVIAASSTLARCVRACQEHEDALEDVETERLHFQEEHHGRHTAGGGDGNYTITEWEVA